MTDTTSTNSTVSPRAIRLLALALIGALAGCGAYLLSAWGQPGAAKATLGANPETAQPAVAAKIEVVTPEKTSRPGFVSVTGSLAADEESKVASKSPGNVIEAKFERGSVVHKGDTLVVLDRINAEYALKESEAAAEELRVRLGVTTGTSSFDPEKQPDVESARSTFELAQADYDRDRDLRSRNVISQADFDRRTNELNRSRQAYNLVRKTVLQLFGSYQTALIRVTTLRQRLDDLVIRAPFDGVVAERMVSPGEHVAEGAPVATLVRIKPLRLALTVPEQHVGLARKDAEVEFTVMAVPDRTFRGRIAYVGPKVDSLSRAMTVEALVENADGALRPGYFATARLLHPTTEKAFRVPVSAVVRRGDVARVFIVRGSEAREQIVTVGDEADGRILVTSGLADGDQVVADASRVSDGARVK